MDNMQTTANDFDFTTVGAAYRGTSFVPEKRATDAIVARVLFLNEKLTQWQALCTSPEQVAYLQTAFPEYKVKCLSMWCQQDRLNSRCMSTMITGGSNFPVRSQEKKRNAVHNHHLKFCEWGERAEKAIRKKIANLMPAGQKDEIDYQHNVRDIMRTPLDNNLCKQNLAGRLERWAATASQEQIVKVLTFLREYQEKHYSKFKFTDRHRVWKICNTQPTVTPPTTETEINGVRIVNNVEIDRVQLFFDSKPNETTRNTMKRSGWCYSPTQGAWQRKLTANGCASANQIATEYAQNIGE